jgi:methyl-accepting chemotaxis protein
MTAALGVAVTMNLMIGAAAWIGLRAVAASKNRVIAVDLRLVVEAERIQAIRGERASTFRGYLLTGEPSFNDEMTAADADFTTLLEQIRARVHTAEGRRQVERIKQINDEYHARQLVLIEQRRQGLPLAQVQTEFTALTPQRVELAAAVTALGDDERRLARAGQRSSTAIADRDIRLVLGLVVVATLLAAVLSVVIARRVRGRIGMAVGQVQSSSAELASTANQQAVGAMEQATAMSEISTTITELLATSRQITESAQRVSGVAELTAVAGRSGVETVAAARESMGEIRRQVDVIVNHMLELGDKSQRIGAVLDIVSELAEQTNILAINSTIEAAGAGESGRRFAVVADEVRKLADRVAESTKEIRILIEVVRGAVHTTVIATEIGSKAVDAGTAQFAGVSSSFEEIVGLVGSTTEAAREIELSTKQQTTAVEQVNFAVTNVTQTTQESQASSSQTLRTASELTELSSQLRQLVEPSAAR